MSSLVNIDGKNGILLIDKPKDFTSFDVVAVVRKLLNVRKVGHTGTLDPFATGVLPILMGKTTKALQFIEDTDKEYIAEFKLGIKTDTQDITGKILDEREVCVNYQQIKQQLSSFQGEILQIPPMYSALKINGKKLCDLARQNKEVRREPRKIKISKIELMDFNEGSGIGKLFVASSKGTYIRTICNDLGEKLGCGATTLSLIRTKACSFCLEDCITIEEARKLSETNLLMDKIICTDRLFENYKSINFSDSQTVILKNGGTIQLDIIPFSSYDENESEYKVKAYNGDVFFAIAKLNLETGKVKLLKQF